MQGLVALEHIHKIMQYIAHMQFVQVNLMLYQMNELKLI